MVACKREPGTSLAKVEEEEVDSQGTLVDSQGSVKVGLRISVPLI